ncbi:uncharacterized protein K444DRAFT_618525 [Hyaloscypha bicolor E]|uniref:Uncharacterized protein n=1 Tax=Hyaloscypha bicolor E TaxID=1095630 RepID=A0A2J6STE4_9HELO|nr:uncharacterized protein K444DRAFT_618525 [Hyaloscypha bicolor E]PMD54061.1 hypothetical protein K444DRAFT_618525 [Hyaloscypha bicolor E]
MKLVISANIFPAFAMGLILLTIHVSATTERGLSVAASQISSNFNNPTAVRVFSDPTTCSSGRVPIYTNPKGGRVDCGDVSEGYRGKIPVPFIAVILVSYVMFGVFKAML